MMTDMVMPRVTWSGAMPRHRPRSLVRAVCLLFLFCCFLPYPALPIGNNTGLEASQALALLLLPALLLIGLPPRHLTVLMLFVIPNTVSAAIAVVSGDALSASVAIRSLVFAIIAMLVLLPAGWYARAANLPALLRIAALAMIGHAVVGAYQVYAFGRGWFPLLRLYRNPTYASMADVADVYVQYVKRPFGLFPEPSAMAAALGPWLVIVTGVLLYPDLLRPRLSGRTRFLLTIAVFATLGLIVWSQTGFTVPLLAILAVVSLPWVGRSLAKYFVVRRLIAIAVVLVAAVVVIELSVARLDKRLSSPVAEVWGDRKASIELGLSIPTSSPTAMLVGVGPGQSTLYMEQVHALGTIWSVTVRSVAETGLVGAAALVIVFCLLVRSVLRSSARWLGGCTLIAWAIAVTLVTSYGLAALWLLVAMLLAWDRLFPPQVGLAVTRNLLPNDAGVRGGL